MSALEREIIEKFHQLDKHAQRRVREIIVQEAETAGQAATPAFDYDAWFRNIEKLRHEIRASHGNKLPSVDVVSLLRDIRDGEDE